jgi:AAA+ superfamily predicted ATPase
MAMDRIEVLRKMVAENPRSASAWYLLGVEYRGGDMASEALAAFSEALKYCDDDLRRQIFEQLAQLSGSAAAPVQQQPPAVGDPDIDSDGTKDDEDDDETGADGDDDETVEDGDDDEASGGKVIPLRVIGGGKKGATIPHEDKAVPTVTFEDVGGLENLKDTIRMKIIKPFTNPGLFARFKKKTGGGILLYGPPGCGKTFIARATAGECGASFIPVHITDILDPYLGVSEQNVKDIFSSARNKKPCVLFFDEIDALGFHRAKSSSEIMRPVVDQLLAEMEGIDTSTDKMLIIGATNMPWDVDPAFKRPGRFDKVVFVPPPDEKARTAIFQLKLTDRPVEEIDFTLLAKRTELYSGADIENVVEVATEKVIAEIMDTGAERPINMKDLLAAVEETRPSTLDWLRTIKNYVKYANQAGLYDDVDKFLTKHKGI